jgi:putative sterol carrier protein
VPRYLSAEWLEAAQLALAADDVLAKAAAEVELSVQQQVTGGPDGDIAFHVDVDHGAVNLLSGDAENPTVTFIQSYDTAAAIGRGELSAQGAFMTGLIRVRGDLPKLVEHGDVFGGVDDVLAELRTQTTY